MINTGQPSDPDSLRALWVHIEPLIKDPSVFAYATMLNLTASELYEVLKKDLES